MLRESSIGSTPFWKGQPHLSKVAEGIVSSPEYFQDHGSTNQGYVLAMNNQVLGRTPSANELNSWVSALNAGESRMAVAVGFLTSTEYQTDLVKGDYRLYLNRAADMSNLTYWAKVRFRLERQIRPCWRVSSARQRASASGRRRENQKESEKVSGPFFQKRVLTPFLTLF